MMVSILKAKSKKWFTPLGWIIKRSQKTEWTHYAIEFGPNLVSDAKRKGIRVIPRHEWLDGYEIVDVVTIELPCNYNELNAWVTKKKGTKYAFWQLIGIAMITCGWVKRNPFGKDNKYLVCHEYVMVMLQDFLGVDIGDSDDYDFKKADEVLERFKI